MSISLASSFNLILKEMFAMEKVMASIKAMVAISLPYFGKPPVAMPSTIAMDMVKEKLDRSLSMCNIQIGLFILFM